MSNATKLAVDKLPEGWVDLTIGEPYVVIDALKEALGENVLEDILNCSDIPTLRYLPPDGDRELLGVLEKRYSGKIIVGAGATQLLAASMYAIKKMDKQRVCLPSPWWILTPEIIEAAGLQWCTIANSDKYIPDAMLFTSPNNPDGKTLTEQEMKNIDEWAAKDKIPLVHDASYFTPLYVDYPNTIKCGDVQIYSLSKMYGLSGVRLGFARVHNEEMYEFMRRYMEINSMGVSRLSQHVAYKLLDLLDKYPGIEKKFNKLAKKKLDDNRRMFMKEVNPEVVDCSKAVDQHGMFIWARPGIKYDPDKTKCKIIDGAMFGSPGYLRISIALPEEELKKAIANLNASINS